jgi:hypothetical protein
MVDINGNELVLHFPTYTALPSCASISAVPTHLKKPCPSSTNRPVQDLGWQRTGEP